ncbi:delta-like protein 1 [Physella acuta]|uniref:delta-like protein 1 n=1 Tax=Physella acuta TaxID=109671 RepID=UPI0027DC38BE|nr:delta-like protein 1 [Physella acuta]
MRTTNLNVPFLLFLVLPFLDPCSNFPCYNGGQCTAPADAPYCVCPPDYTGANCETRVTSSERCPVIEPGSVGVCGGILCSDDSHCPSGQMCCDSACGAPLCTPVDTPTYLPNPRCGVCRKGQICVNTGIVCVRSPCPGQRYRCVDPR